MSCCAKSLPVIAFSVTLVLVTVRRLHAAEATLIAFPGNGGQSLEHDRRCASLPPDTVAWGVRRVVLGFYSIINALSVKRN